MANPTPDFPTSLHSATDISAFTGSNLGDTTPTHTNVHGKLEEEMTATQRKLGAGSSFVPPNGGFLVGVGTGSSTWSAAGTLPIRGSGLAFTASGTGNVIAFLDNNGNLFISGNYLQL